MTQITKTDTRKKQNIWIAYIYPTPPQIFLQNKSMTHQIQSKVLSTHGSQHESGNKRRREATLLYLGEGFVGVHYNLFKGEWINKYINKMKWKKIKQQQQNPEHALTNDNVS